MAAFKPFFRAYGDGALVRDLMLLFEDLEKDIPELAAKKSKKTKDAMYAALRAFEAERPDQWEVIASEDQFYGISKGKNRLEKYVQWVFIPAVKDASDEQSETKTGALGKLLARTVRAKVNFSTTLETVTATAREQYQKMLDDNAPQARHLAGVFEKLSQDNAQILVTTHSPYFVSGKNFESVRMVRRSLVDHCASINQYSYSRAAARFAEVVGEPPKEKSAALSKIHQALQPALNEMFFTQRLVLVEGLEDVAYIHSWLILTERWEDHARTRPGGRRLH